MDAEDEEMPDDANTHRRKIVSGMFKWLVSGVCVLTFAIIGSIVILDGKSEYLQGIVLTALAGAISSLLTFVGIIVKGLVDNLGLPDTGRAGTGKPPKNQR